SRYVVQCVNIEVYINDLVFIPEELLKHHPNQLSLVTEGKQTELKQIITKHMNIATDAFVYWLSVLRWKSGIAHIGEPQIVYAGQRSGPAALRANDTGHRFWIPDGYIRFPSHGLVDEDHWTKAEVA